ncbi:MAG: ABC transporter substrate-binding protein, partial [Pseudomonadota bacterium]
TQHRSMQRKAVSKIDTGTVIPVSAKPPKPPSPSSHLPTPTHLNRRDHYKATECFVARESVGSKCVSSVMDTRVAPFDDPRAREALKVTTPRQQTIDKVLGYAIPDNDHPIPPTDPFIHSEMPQRPFELDRAGQLLRQAGFAGARLNPSAADAAFSGAVDASLIASDMLGLAGPISAW